MVLNIKFEIDDSVLINSDYTNLEKDSLKIIENKVGIFLKDFKLTTGINGKTVPLFKLKDYSNNIEYKTYGYYKHSKFEKLYESFKEVMPNLTPEIFSQFGNNNIDYCNNESYRYNKYLMIKGKYDSRRKDLLCKKKTEKIFNGFKNLSFTFSILCQDIKPNKELIIKVIKKLEE